MRVSGGGNNNNGNNENSVLKIIVGVTIGGFLALFLWQQYLYSTQPSPLGREIERLKEEIESNDLGVDD